MLLPAAFSFERIENMQTCRQGQAKCLCYRNNVLRLMCNLGPISVSVLICTLMKDPSLSLEHREPLHSVWDAFKASLLRFYLKVTAVGENKHVWAGAVG